MALIMKPLPQVRVIKSTKTTANRGFSSRSTADYGIGWAKSSIDR